MSGVAGVIAAVLAYQLTEGKWRWLWALLAGIVVALVAYDLLN